MKHGVQKSLQTLCRVVVADNVLSHAEIFLVGRSNPTLVIFCEGMQLMGNPSVKMVFCIPWYNEMFCASSDHV